MPIISHHKCLTFQLRTAAVVFFLNAKNSCLYLLFFLFVPLFIGFLFNTFLFLPIRFSIYLFLSFSSCFSSFLFSYVSIPLILFFSFSVCLLLSFVYWNFFYFKFDFFGVTFIWIIFISDADSVPMSLNRFFYSVSFLFVLFSFSPNTSWLIKRTTDSSNILNHSFLFHVFASIFFWAVFPFFFQFLLKKVGPANLT